MSSSTTIGTTSENLVMIINEKCFGKDKHRSYLKDDFCRVLEGLIQREVLLHIFIACSEKRHKKKISKDEKGNDVSIAYGDFDPDNAGFLYPILATYEKGLMINMRQLLAKEAGAGGKFIQDITALNTDDFMSYYTKSSSRGVWIPPLLYADYIDEHQKGTKKKVAELLMEKAEDINSAVAELIEQARLFRDRNYYTSIIKKYEGAMFHKDRFPDKYDIHEEVDSLGLLPITVTIRRNKANVEASLIIKCLNEFAEIISKYQSLVSENTSFIGSHWALDIYVRRAFALFSKEVSDEIRQKCIESLTKSLKPSLNLVGWQTIEPCRAAQCA